MIFLEFLGRAKVAKLDLVSGWINQYVLGLDVAVDDALGVEVGHCSQ